MLKRSSPRNCKMTFIIGRAFAECQILKKGHISWTEWNIWQTFALTLILARSSPRDCEMSFVIGRGFAELQILKKWKWPYLLNFEEYYDEFLHTHWYWQDVANEIVKWHLGLAEVQIPKKVKLALSLEPFVIFWEHFAYPLLLTWSRQRDCQI